MNDAFEPYLYTVVTLSMGGQVTFNRCVADVFDQGLLTITSTVDNREVVVLDGWELATVLDHNHHVVYCHVNEQAEAERKSA